MDLDFIQAIGSLGVGAFLGTLVFVMYRIDRKSSEDKLQGIILADQKTREENTKALTELITLLKKMNGNSPH